MTDSHSFWVLLFLFHSEIQGEVKTKADEREREVGDIGYGKVNKTNK